MTFEPEEVSAEEQASQGPSRRGVLKTAAWAAPAVAIASAAPLASASITNPATSLAIAGGSSLSLNGPNEAGSTVSGNFGGSATVTNVGPGWDVDGMTVEYSIEGPIEGALLFFNAVPVDGSAPTITHEGYVWSVDTAAESYVFLTLLSTPVVVPENGSTTVPVPVLQYSETLTNSAAWLPLGRRVRATVQVEVTSGGDSLSNGNVNSLPTSAG